MVEATTTAKKVRASKEDQLFQILTYSSPVGVYISSNGKFIFINPQFQKDTGFSSEELLSMYSNDLIYPEDRSLVEDYVRNVIAGNYSLPCECRTIRKDGEIRWVIETIGSITYEGKPAILGYYMDITERKELEWKIIRYIDMDKIKKNLLSTVSHELTIPLATIKGYANMLINYKQKLSAHQKQDFIQTIEQESDRLSEFVNNLLDMSRLETGMLKLDKKPLSIARLLKIVWEQAKLLSPDREIELTIHGPLHRVNMDSWRIKEVLNNLISNAIKYSPQKSKIQISAKESGNEILIGVSDRGIGIPGDSIDKVFNPLFRIGQKNDVGGLGLGLSICKGLIEAHGGRIWIESKEGVGSTFWFTLPRYDSRAINK